MSNDTNSLYPMEDGQGKDKYFEAQERKFRAYLRRNTATCTMASEALGIPQKNLTWCKRRLEDKGQLVEVFKAKCKHTKHQAFYLSTNKEIIKKVKSKK